VTTAAVAGAGAHRMMSQNSKIECTARSFSPPRSNRVHVDQAKVGRWTGLHRRLLSGFVDELGDPFFQVLRQHGGRVRLCIKVTPPEGV
jgi:hypothetical protein